MKNQKRVAVMALAVFLVLVLRFADASGSKHTFLPVVQQIATLQNLALEPVAEVEMPFSVYNGVQPGAVQAKTGWWYVTVYRTGEMSGTWIVRWREGMPAAEGVAFVTPTTAIHPGVAEPIPGGPYTDARGDLTCGYDHRIYHFAWDGNGEHPVLRIGRLSGEQC